MKVPGPPVVVGVVLVRQHRLAVDTLVGERPRVAGRALDVPDRNVAVLPWVWKAASCRTVTGLVVLARTQYGLEDLVAVGLDQSVLVERHTVAR